MLRFGTHLVHQMIITCKEAHMGAETVVMPKENLHHNLQVKQTKKT